MNRVHAALVAHHGATSEGWSGEGRLPENGKNSKRWISNTHLRTGHVASGLLALLFIVVLSNIASPPAMAQEVAVVTDVSGRVSAAAPVSIMSEIAAETRMQVEAGAKLTVIYIKSGDEYVYTGPAQIQFGETGPRTLSGAQPQKRVSPIARGGSITIKPIRVTQAAFVPRGGRPTPGVKLLTPSGKVSLDGAPVFRWQGLEPGLTYQFELTDDMGKSLHEAQVADTSMTLPAAVRLREGVTYTWEIAARGQDGRRYASTGEFSLASSALRSDANALRPVPGASVSDRVAYAAWLDQMELKDEARKYWKALAAERPNDVRLRELAKE